MRWKRTELHEVADECEISQRQVARNQIRADLERRGVPAELSERLSHRVEGRAVALEGDAYETLLEGAAAAVGVHDRSEQEMSQQLQDLQEIERLMGGFSKELAKLDEVLEVLAAHVRRMRSNAPSTGDRRLH